MITKWKLGNFKSVSDLQELDFGGLTILAGANSSGKSTILQSILLVRQTLANHNEDNDLVLNGPIIQLGEIDDVISKYFEKDYIYLGFNLQNSHITDYYETNPDEVNIWEGIENVDCDLSVFIKPKSNELKLLDNKPILSKCDIKWTTNEYFDYGYHNFSYKIGIQRSENNFEKSLNILPNDLNEAQTKALDYDITIERNGQKWEGDSFPFNSDPVGVNRKHFLPWSILYKYNETERDAQACTFAICDKIFFEKYFPRSLYTQNILNTTIPDKIINYLENVLGGLSSELIHNIANRSITIETFQNRVYSLEDEKRYIVRNRLNIEVMKKMIKLFMNGKPSKENLMFSQHNNHVKEVSSFIESYFTFAIKYLGPLREDPSYLYQVAPLNDPYDVGNKGQYTASVFHEFKNKNIFYIPTSYFQEPKIDIQEKKISLQEAVIDWLQYLDIASEVQTKDMHKYGIQLTITPLGSHCPIEMKHVGTGVSQILPIVVICLAAEDYSTILIEQPELHLHPKVQSRLADFFLSMALTHRQLIIETHSEHIINRIRYRIAATDESILSDLTKIHFVEKKQGQSTFRQIEVNEYGSIKEWPEGFFDQAHYEAESILRAAMEKRKSEKSK